MIEHRETISAHHGGERRAQAPARLHGRRLLLVRMAWVALVGMALVMFVVALPLNFQAVRMPLSPETRVPQQLPAADVQLLQEWGVSPDFYAAYETATTAIFGFAFIAAGALLFWRKPDDRMVLFLAFWFPIVGVCGHPVLDPLARAYPRLELPVRFLQGASLGCFPIFTYLFPDGRFVPRWTRILTFAWIAFIAISPFTPFAVADFEGASELWFGALIPGGMGLGIVAQVYRYLRISGRAERQQTKWVLFGFSTVALGIFLYSIAPAVIPAVLEPGLARVLYRFFAEAILLAGPWLLLLMCIGIAILRYRLWDIDHLIRRTLVYGVSTASLALFYLGAVAMVQPVLRPLTAQSDVAIVISTLAIAVLFNPLRRRIQVVIDRHFYRRKYDAARTLHAFGQQLRDEVDLHRVSEDLLAVVEETLQPTHVSLWLRHYTPGGRARRVEEGRTQAIISP